MNPKLVEEVARAIYATRGYVHDDEKRMFQPVTWEEFEPDEYAPEKAAIREEARAAIRVCMARAAEIAESYEPRCDTCPSGVTNAIKREGGVT